jgi:aerobic carbon-monoxide dehydrogenase medium subunit
MTTFNSCDGHAHYLAGGQSLIPALNLRLVAPDLLIDINGIDELRGIQRSAAEIRVGALTRHVELLRSSLIAETVPLLASAIPFVAHPAIRNKGTFGGSLALADPAAEFPAVALALRARMEIFSGKTRRSVDADDFFLGLYQTALQPSELLTAVTLPAAKPSQLFVFDELARRRGDFATVGLAIALEYTTAGIENPRIVFFAIGPTPKRAKSAELALQGSTVDEQTVEAVVDSLDNDLDPDDDPTMSAKTRMHLARVLLRRNLNRLSNKLQNGKNHRRE